MRCSLEKHTDGPKESKFLVFRWVWRQHLRLRGIYVLGSTQYEWGIYEFITLEHLTMRRSVGPTIV
jgi:hypothetical protein